MPPEHDRHAEERPHQRMRGRPPAAEARVGRDVVGAEWRGVGEHGAEQPVGSRERAQRLDLVVGHPGWDEEARALLVGHPEGGVAGIDQFPGRPHQPLRHGVERQVAGDPEDRFADGRQRAARVAHVVRS